MFKKAYAKVNLTLDITGIRPDGYHSVRTVMVPVSIYDEMDIELADDISMECNIPSLSGDNLCLKAASLFYKEADIKGGARIKLKKNIPFPAGLGGGSSDAAATLAVLNKLNGGVFTENKLLSLAAALGSDVPFFVDPKPCLCEGRGEELTEVRGFPKLNLVIAIGEGRLSTPAVYKAYDASGLKPTDNSSALLAALKNNNTDAFYSSVSNSFEAVSSSLCPETDVIKGELLSSGAVKAMLSGSGPSVFGIFNSKKDAEKAEIYLKNKGFSAYSCETLE